MEGRIHCYIPKGYLPNWPRATGNCAWLDALRRVAVLEEE